MKELRPSHPFRTSSATLIVYEAWPITFWGYVHRLEPSDPPVRPAQSGTFALSFAYLFRSKRFKPPPPERTGELQLFLALRCLMKES